MEVAYNTVKLSIVLCGLGAVVAMIAGSAQASFGILLGGAAGVLSILSLTLLTKVVTAAGTPQQARNWAVFWMMVKLPILGLLVVVAGRLGEVATWSFVWSVGSVYSLLLCLGWLAARSLAKPVQEGKNTEQTSRDDTKY